MAASLLTLYLVGTIAVLVALVLLASGVFAMGMAPHCSTAWSAWPARRRAGAVAARLRGQRGHRVRLVRRRRGDGSFTASAAVITGLIIAVIAIPVAWAELRL